MPSLIIITLIATFFKRFQQIDLFQHAFAAIQIAVVALIIDIVIKMWQKSDKTKVSLLIFLLAFLLLVIFNISPVFVILGSAAAGILIQYFRGNLQNAYYNYQNDNQGSDE